MRSNLVPSVLLAHAKDIYPQSLTILPTYRCTAECQECCFESNPRLKRRLSFFDIISAIKNAKQSFPSLQLIVFSGGEVFLLKEELYLAIEFARDNGLNVRCVTNAFWGKTMKNARHVASRLSVSGVSEINISTGSDHQKFVPLTSIENACEALVENNIQTLVTVEQDASTTNCLNDLRNSIRIGRLIRETPRWFTIQCNSWMPFHDSYVERGAAPGLKSLTEGCTQIFNNLVVTPYGKLAACCGLTFEHIPELTIGDLADISMSQLFDFALLDFLKIWIHLDGPGVILRKLFGDEINEELQNVRHICQACAILHLHPRIREEIKARYKEFLPDVLARFTLRVEMRRRELTLTYS